MPKRMVDGDALWRSDKLAKVQPPSFRAEYANLIPLALADGTFEANPRRVWADVYSYNRPDISLPNVEAILNEFERVGLLTLRTDVNNKVWGFWVGIESRLPSESTKDRYKNGNPSIFKDVQNITTESRPTHDVIMTGLGLDKDRIGLGKNSNFKNISTRFRSYFNFKPAKRDKEQQEYADACAKFGEDYVLEKFEPWALENREWIKDKKAAFALSGYYRDLEEIRESDQMTADRDKKELDTKTTNVIDWDSIHAENAKKQAEVLSLAAEMQQEEENSKSIPVDQF